MAFEAVKAKWHSECWMVQRRPAPISCEEMYRGRKIWRFWQKNLEENWEVNRFHGFLQCFLYYVSTMCQTNNRDLQHVCTNFYQQNYWAMFTRLIDKTTKTCWGPRLKTMRLCTTRLVVQTWFLTIWFHLWQSQSRIPDFVTVESLFINDSQWFNCTIALGVFHLDHDRIIAAMRPQKPHLETWWEFLFLAPAPSDSGMMIW